MRAPGSRGGAGVAASHASARATTLARPGAPLPRIAHSHTVSDAPAGFLKLLPHLGVALPVAGDLRAPESRRVSGQAKQRAVVAVPETAIHKNRRTIAGKRHVGFPGTLRG